MLNRFTAETTLPRPGDRVKAVHWQWSEWIDDNLTVPPGTEGTVDFADELQIAVNWDNGSRINLVPGDKWAFV